MIKTREIKLQIKEANLANVKSWQGVAAIDDDLVLLDQLNNISIPHEARRMNFILIALCTKGQVEYSLDTQSHTVRPGELLVISERHVVNNYASSPDFEGLAMILSVDFFREVINNVADLSAVFLLARSKPVMALSEHEMRIFTNYFYTIKDRIESVNNHFRKALVRTLLLALLYDMSNVVYQFQQTADQRLKRGDIIFTRFIKMVEEYCGRERRVSWYAGQLGITPKYLSETVKEVSRRTPNEWIDNYVIVELRVLLKNTTKSIKQITEEMHFPNQSFLGKYFKEHVGVSPSEYRKRRS
jgi:AraC-like DNA-binding protein